MIQISNQLQPTIHQVCILTSNYNHSYENGLKSIREEWLKNREGLFQDKKTKVKISHSL